MRRTCKIKKKNFTRYAAAKIDAFFSTLLWCTWSTFLQNGWRTTWGNFAKPSGCLFPFFMCHFYGGPPIWRVYPAWMRICAYLPINELCWWSIQINFSIRSFEWGVCSVTHRSSSAYATGEYMPSVDQHFAYVEWKRVGGFIPYEGYSLFGDIQVYLYL